MRKRFFLIIGSGTLTIMLLLFLWGMDKIFVLLSPPRVFFIAPAQNEHNIPLRSRIVVTFTKPIKRQEIKHSLIPDVHGEWSFQDPVLETHLFRTLVFTPVLDFTSDTQYLVQIEGIKGFGLRSQHTSFSFSFRTKSSPSFPAAQSDRQETSRTFLQQKTLTPPTNKSVTVLEIPLDWQDHALSCEAASLKMALNYKEVFVSEEEIMKKVGYDPTPRQNNVWGDPYETFVGNIDGKICATGFGVFETALARAAGEWRPAQSFFQWGIQDLTREIAQGNPVVVWGTLPNKNLRDCSWHTKDGRYIKAFRETHVRLAIGFLGSPESPTAIILNDPLAGRLYWSADYFLQNWSAFDHRGVVIR